MKDLYARLPFSVLDRLLTLDGAAIRVYLALLRHVGRTAVVWPSVRRIAELAKISQRQAIRETRALAATGLITMKKRTTDDGEVLRSNVYTLTGLHPSTMDGDTGVTISGHGCQPTPDTHVISHVTPASSEVSPVMPNNRRLLVKDNLGGAGGDNWKAILFDAGRYYRRDRRLVFPKMSDTEYRLAVRVIALLHRRRISERALVRAIESVDRRQQSGDPLGSPIAYFRRALQTECESDGVDFEKELKAVPTPPIRTCTA